MAETQGWNVGRYLLRRLEQAGLRHVFGVPGDFVLGFMDQILESGVELVTTCNELNAGYAADGYARINGIGGVVTTYAVGEFSAINAVAGAYSEKVPVVAITGAPTVANRKHAAVLHHTLGDYNIPVEVFQRVTVAAVSLTDPVKAPEQIDKALRACLYHKRPVYIELPSDITRQACAEPGDFEFPEPMASDPAALAEAVDEAVALLGGCNNPAILAGVEIHRYGLQESAGKLLEKTGYPFATMLLGKTVLPEKNPQFIGLYEGMSSRDYVRERIENAGGLLCLGTFMSDINLGGFTAKLDNDRLIVARDGRVRIKNHYYNQVSLRDFIKKLTEKLPAGSPESFDVRPAVDSCTHRKSAAFEPQAEQKLTNHRFYDRMAHFIQADDIVIADGGSAIFSAGEVFMPDEVTFIGQAFYCSIGYTVGAVLGAGLAAPKRRVVVFVGDGAFQLTCQELSTVIRNNLDAIVFVINNDGYTVERLIIDGPYNDIQPWKYHLLPDVFGGGWGCEVHTEGDLEDALETAKKNQGLSLIEVHFDRMDCSDSLRRACEQMAAQYKRANPK
ncbi:MAG: thiamine pyrophosphate-binding protein [Candidatus Brocadiales bacterium]|nr:thiamine pyrophosphate-binding protein [Candidatus Bathyanammoxibius amoris]